MILSLIVAMTRRGVIGANNALPWHLPEDLKRFKKLTLGHPIVMGRKTYDSIGRPLPGRQNIVISRNRALRIPGVTCVDSLEAALAPFENTSEEVFIIGGSQIFADALSRAHRLYVTWVEQDIPGDIVFPTWNTKAFTASGQEDHLDGLIPYRYVNYDRTF